MTSMTKLALLLALAIGGLALCDGRPYSGRGLLASTKGFTCRGGEAYDGNNRPGKLPTCASGSFLCRTEDCADGVPCSATCSDPARTPLTLSHDPSNGTVTVKKGEEEVKVDNGQYKGCDAYCEYPAGGTAPGVPIRASGTPCGLSHADFCYTPCQCDKEKVVFYYDGKPVEDEVIICPGAALPDSTKYTAVDNCGKTLAVTVSDGSKDPEGGPCGAITRNLAATCRDAEVTKTQKITYGDTGITFTEGCPVDGSSEPVEGSSKCVAATKLTPVLTYMDCVFKAEYKLENACGEESTKTVTSCGTCGSA